MSQVQKSPSAAGAPARPGAPGPARPDTHAPADSQRLSAESLKTTHRVIAAFDRDAKGLEWLHGDLFDAREEVALSALDAVGAVANPSSYSHLTRLLGSMSDAVKLAAVRALGKVKHPGSAKALVSLLKTARGEALRREILDALAVAVPKDKELAGFVRQIARSPMTSAAARAHAVGLLLRLRGEAALEELLPDAREETVDQILHAAMDTPALAAKVVEHYAPSFGQLHAHSRVTLTTLALANALDVSGNVLRCALSDSVADVRRAAYTAIGTAAHHARFFGEIIELLLGHAETNTALEDEVHLAIERMAKTAGGAGSVPSPTRARVIGRIGEVFRRLREEGRQIASESHELGWLIVRSREYMEYYCDEEFKAGLLRYLRGASTDTEGDLLRKLKATAVRVEVRHFDGYTALAEIIRNPRRAGMTLVARELALTQHGRGQLFHELIRAVRLATVFFAPGTGGPAIASLKEVFAWSRQEKLFRLAEAALLAVSRLDPAAGLAACDECLTPPLTSKVLAIASLHLMRDLAPQQLEPAAARLLTGQDDPYLTLNAVEAVAAGPPSSNGDLAKALLSRLSLASSREVIESLDSYLGEKMSLDIMESLRDMYAGGDADRKAAALSIIGSRFANGLAANREATLEFLYRILRGSDSSSRRTAAMLLWKLGDDYAPEVLRDFLSTGSAEDRAATLRGLIGSLRVPLLPDIAPLLSSDSAVVHDALRDLLLSVSEELKGGVLEMALRLRGTPPAEEGELGVPEDAHSTVDFRTERRAFQFERENVQELVILFTDIVGYSKKAQFLSPLQLSTLLQDYEKILLAQMGAHHGDLVKRMGDGHLFVFQDPLHAVLAAIRMQKSLRRFNRYRDESSRVVIRIGINHGKVVRKEQGDVLGNTVNIASRLETNAQPGSVLVSEQVHEKVKDSIHDREIGRITVKNIAEPIRVFEPYEIALDLPASLDPLKGAQPSATSSAREPAPAGQQPSASESEAAHVDPEILRQIARCFENLERICRESHDGVVPLAQVNDQVLSRWGRIRGSLPLGGA
ncbi:MAG TPA: adenylate/guanylate cyclase domain-containing protein [Spirochaetia bacterium]|nr:adenylate/guanylate cyclase domain-containing protein [Spirochaetia bacterium]